MFQLIFVLFLTILNSPASHQSSPESPVYIAAVVEYAPVSEVGSDGMRGLVSQNVDNYVHFIEEAAQKDADIVVFPEVGLTSYGKPLYASPVPDPRERANPCTNSSSGMLEEIARLSCAARNNDIYVVINFPEVKVCEKVVPGSDCEHIGTFHYNCDIVFDRRGYLVARYRKYNLFLEHEFDKTPTPDISIFETDFGVKFGVFTCFDVLFKAPAVAMVQQFNVTDVAVPQAWFSELPFLTSVQAQSQWASAMDVNMLAAGYSKPSVGSTGSGIYNGRRGPLATVFSAVDTSKLLVATVQKKITNDNENLVSVMGDGNNLQLRDETRSEFFRNDDRESLQLAYESNSIASGCAGSCKRQVSDDRLGCGEMFGALYLMKENLTAYTTTLLDVAKPNGPQQKNVSLRLCSGDLCCDFEVRSSQRPAGRNTSDGSSHYRAVVFSGVRSFVGAADAGLQVCGVVWCSDESPASCGSPPSTVGGPRPAFDHISIAGRFNASNSVQMPNALAVDFKIINPRAYSFTKNVTTGEKVGVTLELKDVVSNLITFGIYGRYFDNDVLH
ncbi:vanin-like protein 2 isoform X2 [Bacillus rossius redtenbacheri]|uniref:vanin-like protein 2 isoform X2 n=1 Tax=Bacillus rossius redtenbacheri TaxID=93214 RepID=UPI002FDD4E30